jgi:hypothetical protein
MATSISLKPPNAFNFRSPDEWPKWCKRFEQFRTASGLSKEDEVRQVSTLLYCLGEEAEDVLASANITEDDRKTYKTVLDKLDAFFQVRKNVIFERARFNKRDQKEGEAAEEYITALYNLVSSCDYGDLATEMIRDRLVVGIRDTALSQRLQVDPDLTLEKAKRQIRQKEAVSQQQHTLGRTGPQETTVSFVQGKKPASHPKNFQRRHHHPPQCSHPQGKLPSTSCTRCGGAQHSRNVCPAKDATCHNCEKKGHYSRQCLSKGRRVAEVTDDNQDVFFLTPIVTDSSNAWHTTVSIEGHNVSFKLDTGAEVTALNDLTSKQLGLVLTAPIKKLCGADRAPLDVLGMASATMTTTNGSTKQDVFVISGLKHNLLGLPAIKSLGLLTPVDSIQPDSLEAQVHSHFPELFTGLGRFSGAEFEIHLKDDAKPTALYTPRKIPFPLREKVHQELQRMESLGVISKVEQPTEWCAGMVVIPKKDGNVRICVDLKPLNTSVLRETHPLPRVDDLLAQLSGAKLFSKLDANSGFWQVPLAEQSRHLTTFITPFGRYCFNTMPFGISSAPEHFQRRMNEILEGLPGVVCLVDDILVHGSNEEEHKSRLFAVLDRIRKAGVTLNTGKCVFAQTSTRFLGHFINADGIQAETEKTSAITNMETPKSVPELRRFLGMVNQLGKFSPNIAELTKPLRELLGKKSSWLWGPPQDTAFQKIKTELASPPLLAWYDPSRDTKISADASSYGLGAVLLQCHEDVWRPVAYASRSMTSTELHYAQIEKEALATTWAAEHFSDYIIGRDVLFKTDHKPLIPLLNTKHLDSLPPRVLRFRLRLMRFNYSVQYVPGTLLYTADTLSRSPQQYSSAHEISAKNLETQIAAVTSQLPATEDCLERYRQAQQEDPLLSRVIRFCQTEWPNRQAAKGDLRPYWKVRAELTYCDRLLLYGTRIVIPKALQKDTLTKIHHGHQGIQKCRLRVNTSVWWPGVSQQVEDYVQGCHKCAQNTQQSKEPLLPTPLPQHPWQRVAADLFEKNGKDYLIMVDYFSHYPEVIQLTSTTSASLINAENGLSQSFPTTFNAIVLNSGE